MAKGPGGFISGGNDPLNAPDAPTVDSVSAGILTADVTISAPADAGAGTISSYVVTAKQSDGTSVSNTSASAGTVSLTLTAGGTTTFAAQAISEFGPGAFSGFGNSSTVFSGQEFYSWGGNAEGRLGLGDESNRSSPVQLGSLTNWSVFSGGSNHSSAITTSNEIFSWGDNGTGELGLNDRNDRSSPVQIGALTNWSKVSAGTDFTVAIKADGTLWAWGNGASGRIGDSATTSRSSPVQIGALTNWSQISTGISDKVLAVTTDGELYSWGDCGAGELGQNSNQDQSSPIQVGALTDWSSVSAGSLHSSAVKTDGTLWTWGSNNSGELGHNTGSTFPTSSPVQVGSLTNWSQVCAGDRVTHAIKTDGTLWAFGEGQRLGDGTTINKSSPIQIGSLTDWGTLPDSSAGTVSVVKTDGTLWIWGRGAEGQIGNNSVNAESSPVQVGSLTGWTDSAIGDRQVFAFIGTTS